MKERTSNFDTYMLGSHVKEFGNKDIKHEKASLFLGFDPETANLEPNQVQFDKTNSVNQRDADLIFLWQSVSTCDHFVSFKIQS